MQGFNSLGVFPLTKFYRKDVMSLDEISEICVSRWLDRENVAWGLFDNDELIGYCTMCGADELQHSLPSFKAFGHDTFFLCDVFIKPECRGRGYAVKFVNDVVSEVMKDQKGVVFLVILDDALRHLYEKCGFEYIGDGFMVRDERVKTIDELINEATQVCEEMNTTGTSKSDIEIDK